MALTAHTFSPNQTKAQDNKSAQGETYGAKALMAHTFSPAPQNHIPSPRVANCYRVCVAFVRKQNCTLDK